MSTQIKEKKIEFTERVRGMTNKELLTLLIYVAGLAYVQEKECIDGWQDTRGDLSIIKNEMENRLYQISSFGRLTI